MKVLKFTGVTCKRDILDPSGEEVSATLEGKCDDGSNKLHTNQIKK